MTSSIGRRKRPPTAAADQLIWQGFVSDGLDVPYHFRLRTGADDRPGQPRPSGGGGSMSGLPPKAAIERTSMDGREADWCRPDTRPREARGEAPPCPAPCGEFHSVALYLLFIV